MNAKRNAAAAGFVAVLLAGGLIVSAPAASADSCGSGKVAKVSKEKVVNPLTGEIEEGTVTECVEDGFDGTLFSSVTPAVGVDFRDDNGNRTASGISNNDQFEYLKQKKAGKNGDGELIKIRQITKGKGGWGTLYEGWIPVKYVQLPARYF